LRALPYIVPVVRANEVQHPQQDSYAAPEVIAVEMRSICGDPGSPPMYNGVRVRRSAIDSSQLPRIARSLSSVPFNRFFIAWSQSYGSGPIQTQEFAIDSRQDRQWADFVAHPPVLSFASANPGRLYINGDEPDQYCLAPEDYAVMYHDFVEAIRGADPTARVSPAGFAEPNDRCCPVPMAEEGIAPGSWVQSLSQLRRSVLQRVCTALRSCATSQRMAIPRFRDIRSAWRCERMVGEDR
jgi:hypothetical protein